MPKSQTGRSLRRWLMEPRDETTELEWLDGGELLRERAREFMQPGEHIQVASTANVQPTWVWLIVLLFTRLLLATAFAGTASGRAALGIGNAAVLFFVVMRARRVVVATNKRVLVCDVGGFGAAYPARVIRAFDRTTGVIEPRGLLKRRLDGFGSPLWGVKWQFFADLRKASATADAAVSPS